MSDRKPLIGFSCGDINGIGMEVIIKVMADSRITELCTPVIFGNNKMLNFYRKNIPDINLNCFIAKDSSRINPKQVNIFNVWEEDIAVTPGQLTDEGGKYAVLSLMAATEALKAGKIDGLVTAPIHKKNTQSENFNFTGHTPFLKSFFNASEVVMFMVAENMRIALLTEHVPVKDVSQFITRENLLKKLQVVNNSLKKDFLINKPKIAVLGLNPHAGDEGLIGKEEEEIIKPAIKDAEQRMGIFCFGTYPADAFFARGNYEKFDAVLSLYHDQGLIPFKSLAMGNSANYTAGMSVVRTSPDHGVAFDIAGKGIADETSMRGALFTCLDIIKNREEYAIQHKNPLKNVSAAVVANAVDETLSEE